MASGEHVEVISKPENVQKYPRKLEKTVLDNFSNLVNQNGKIRIKSSVNLLRHLTENENQENENEVKYALGRIIRGLGSSSVSARTGFYTALVALINLKEITVDHIFEHLDKQLHKAGGNSKGENADVCVGQILACGAIIRSNLWDGTSGEQQKKVLEILLKASKERTYLSLVAYMFIINKLDEMNEKDFKKIFPLIQNEFSKPWPEQNIDTLYLLISIKIKYPTFIKSKFLAETIGTNEIICLESIESLCSVLMTIPRLTALKHPIYEVISKELAKSKHLPLFLNELNKNLQKPNRNKQLIVTRMFSIILQNVEDTYNIPNLLVKNFIQQTLNYFKTFTGKNKDVEFQQSMRKFFETLLEALKPDEIKCAIKIAVLKKLLFYPGTFIFEKITKSKVVQHITSSLKTEGVKEMAEVYKSVVEGTEKIDSENAQNEHWLNNDRLYAAHMLIKLLNHPSMKNENDWKVEQLIFLMNLGLLKVEKNLSLGSELAASLKTAFFGALDLNLSRLEDLQMILLQLVKHLDSKLSPDKLEMVLRNPITASEYEIWQKTIEVITKIERKKRKGHGLKSVFFTLFLHMGLQLFNDANLASESLKELFICYEKTRKGRKKSDNIDKSEDTTKVEENDDDPLWIEVVTDLFLNLLSHNYHLLRSLIKRVFPHLCKYITPTTIHQLLSVIDPKNEDNPLSKYNEDSSDDEVDEKEVIAEENESDSEEENDEGESDEENVEDESVNDKLRMALHKVLSNNGYQTDEESIDLDQLSDTEGEKLNKALAEAFVQFKPNLGRSKKQSKDQESLMHFRIRILDLIEIYLDCTPSMIIALEIMLPLLQAVEFSIRDEHQKPLHDRLKACLKKLSSTKKFNDTSGIDDTVLNDLLKSLLEKGTKNSLIIQDMGVQIADCCIFVIRCSDILRSSEETPKKIRKRLKHLIPETISGELHNYFYKRDSLIPYILFKNILQLNWDGVLSLVPLLLEYVFSEAIKPFKKNQAAELLKIFYTNQRYLNNNLEKVNETLSNEHVKFSQNVTTLFRDLCENPTKKSVKEKFICNLFHTLNAMKSSRLNLDNISWSDIAKVITEYRSHVSFSKDTKVAFNKLCNHLSISHIVKMLPKIAELPRITDSKKAEIDKEGYSSNVKSKKEKKKKKKVKSKEQLKLKKEAKQLRLQSLSEGFGVLDFVHARNVDMNENESGSDTFENPKIRKGRRENFKGHNGLSSNLSGNKSIKKRKKYNEDDKEENGDSGILSKNMEYTNKRKKEYHEHTASKKKKL